MMGEDDKVVLTATEKAAIDRLIKAGLTDPKRLRTLSDLVDASMAWGWFRKFLIQAAAATGALSALAAAILLLRDWFTKP